MKNQIEVRAYHKPSKLGRKFLGLPLFGWVALMAMGLAAAVVLGPVLGPKSQTVQMVTLTEHAGNAVPLTVTYGVVNTVILDASSSAAMSPSSGASMACRGLADRFASGALPQPHRFRLRWRTRSSPPAPRKGGGRRL